MIHNPKGQLIKKYLLINRVFFLTNLVFQEPLNNLSKAELAQKKRKNKIQNPNGMIQ